MSFQVIKGRFIDKNVKINYKRNKNSLTPGDLFCYLSTYKILYGLYQYIPGVCGLLASNLSSCWFRGFLAGLRVHAIAHTN